MPLYPIDLCAEMVLARKFTQNQAILVQSAAIGVALNPAAAFAVGLPIAYALQHEWIRV